METEKRSTSNHQHHGESNRADAAAARRSSSTTAAGAIAPDDPNAAISHDRKRPTTPAPSPAPSFSSCPCSRSDLLRIDDRARGLHVDVHRGLFSSKDSGVSDDGVDGGSDDDWYRKLLSNVRWHRVKYESRRFKKECETPCWTAFYGGRSEYAPYAPVPAWFRPLIDRVTSHLGKGAKFNAFLLRLYFDGNDEIAWHTDGRKFLGDRPTIASLSMGSGATFQMRRMNEVWPCADGSKSTENCVDVDTPIQSFVLSDGDLLVMRGDTQKHWHHRVPREKGRGVRLNVNFRYILPGPDSERGQKTYYKYMVYGDCPMDGEPPSWTFDEIMAKRGGMMNFVTKGIKRKGRKCDAGETEEQSTDEHGEGKIRESKKSAAQEPCVAVASTTERVHSSQTDRYKAFISGHDTQQYLESEQSTDLEVFAALPEEIRHELVSQWKARQKNSQSTIVSPAPRGIAAKTIGKRQGGRNQSAVGEKTASKCRKRTLDSFFAKKR